MVQQAVFRYKSVDIDIGPTRQFHWFYHISVKYNTNPRFAISAVDLLQSDADIVVMALYEQRGTVVVLEG